MEHENTKELLRVLKDYAVPDPAIVGKLPKGGFQADFVGHADITRILIEVDPHWKLVPIMWEEGRPKIHIVNDDATCWFEFTLLGQPRLCVGTAKAKSPDLDKILYGDALRNAAMRFGIGLSLWTKQEWEDLDNYKESAPKQKQTGTASKTHNKAPVEPADEPVRMLSDSQISQFEQACAKERISPEIVAAGAGVKLGQPIPVSKLVDLRASLKEQVELRDLAHDRAEEQAEQ